MTEQDKKALSLCGFAARAGAVTVGVTQVCEAMERGHGKQFPHAVVTASDISEGSLKRVMYHAKEYGVPHAALSATSAELAAAVGKKERIVAAVAVSDVHLAKGILAKVGFQKNVTPPRGTGDIK